MTFPVEQTDQSNHRRQTNHPISIQIRAVLKFQGQNEMCVCLGTHLRVCVNALLVYFNEMSIPLEDDTPWGEKTKGSKTEREMLGPDWWRKRRRTKSKKSNWIKRGVAAPGRERAKEETQQRETKQERVSMFQTSHWFLLSGTLVSQELDCSTLPLTDSWPTV